MKNNRLATILFCKEPKRGQGKQRLATVLGSEEAFLIATHLLHCALEDLQAIPGNSFISPASEESRHWAEGLLQAADAVLPQPSGTLGHRLKTVDDTVRSQGYTQTIHMGSDCPAMSQVHYDEAIALLETNDIVLSPAADGGVTLMAASCPWPEMSHLPWGTEKLGEALEHCCIKAGLRVSKTQASFDIDREADLRALLPLLEGDKRPARQAFLSHLQTFL